jgi:hypothetical protein
MGQKIQIGSLIDKGLRADVTPFNIDNNSFQILFNSYQWRGRAKRKRGTSLLGRLTRQVLTQSIGTSGASPWTFNLFSFLTPPISSTEPNASITPGSVSIFFTPNTITANIVSPGYTNASDCEVFTNTTSGLINGSEVNISGVNVVPGTGPNEINGGPYFVEVISGTSFKLGVDSSTWGRWASGGTWTSGSGSTIIFRDQGDGTLLANVDPTDNFGTINYTTGEVTITYVGGAVSVTASFDYYPSLPVMGLEDLELIPTQFPGTIAFDTKYSYNVSPNFPYTITDVSYYKNPPSGLYPGYVAKATPTPLTWNGQNYQQFWTENSAGAMFATNGITVPFNPSNIGMQFKLIVAVTVLTPTTANLQITAHGLIVGDFVFVNEVVTTTGINFQTGYVTTVTDANNVIVTFPNATLATNGTGGIAQYLTSRSDATKDCIRWYDGNPSSQEGWVNFCPPLSQNNFSISGLPLNKYYLVGARMIIEFKDRLLFLGPVVQASSGNAIYLQDTIIYSQNGTPFYTASFTGDVDSAATVFNPLLVPIDQTATPGAYFGDVTGFGGFVSAALSQPLTTVSNNEDVLITGFSFSKARLTYTGNDLIPFVFYVINSELGDASTFSKIDMDKGVITRGSRGYIISSQVQAQRFDLEIPDQVFQIDLTDNGNERFTAGRDFVNEWIYFTYNSNSAENSTAVFPNQTLFYNYRDNSWAVFGESYTTYGSFRRRTGFTWETVGKVYKTWGDWNDPWNAGTSTLLQQEVIGGNQQGFIMIRDEGTGEGTSLYIKSFDVNTNVVTSPDHNLSNGDYIVISDCLGTIATLVNGEIFQVASVTRNTFLLITNPPLNIGGTTYLGGGLLTKIYVPQIQTKQFPVAWDMARKTRIGVQQYLFTKTDRAQVTLQIFLSQNSAFPYNQSTIVPNTTATNNALIYSQVLYTCPESINLGLTAANSNLQTPTAGQQSQIWHRMNTSLIGDTVQIGFTLSDEQIRDQVANNAFAEIELHCAILDVTPSQMLV